MKKLLLILACSLFIISVQEDSFSISAMQRMRNLLNQKNLIIAKANQDWISTRNSVKSSLNQYINTHKNLVSNYNARVGGNPQLTIKGVPHHQTVRRIQAILR